jgi:hypothetical protein
MQQIKYPKTPYFSFSPSVDKDDPIIDLTVFLGKTLILSVKMDGSNTAFHREGIYGRSLYHQSFSEIKALYGKIKHNIPEGHHVFGESLVAKHSIYYNGPLALSEIFMAFAVYDQRFDSFQDWETVLSTRHYGLEVVSFIVIEPINDVQELEQVITSHFRRITDAGHEGIVVRNQNAFLYSDFSTNIAKMVRPNHVQGEIHWTKNTYIKNEKTYLIGNSLL